MARFDGPLPHKLRRIPGADVPKGPLFPYVCLQLRLRAANCRGASWRLATLRPPDWARPDLELGSNASFDVRPCDAARPAYCRRTTHLFCDLFSPVSWDTIQFLQRRQPAPRFTVECP
jgi:hypothetical protein